MHWAVPEKKQTGRGHTFLKTCLLEFFIFFTLPLEIRHKTKLHPWKIHKIVLDPLKFQGHKSRPLEIPHYFFLATLGNFTSFLIKPWEFHMLFFLTRSSGATWMIFEYFPLYFH